MKKILLGIAGALIISLIGYGVFDFTKKSDNLGIAPIDVIALYEDNLQETITATQNTFTLVRGTDKTGSSISGTFGFIIDEGTSLEEFVIANCSSTACSGVLRGISVTDGETEVTALKKAHRKGASIKMTNYPILGRLNRIITGYDSTGSSTFMLGRQVNEDFYLIFDTGATNTPYVRYDSADNQLKFRRNGETSDTEIPLSLRGTYADYASLPTDGSNGDIAITNDDHKLYVYDSASTTWVLSGGSSGAGTMYKTEKLGSESDGGDLKTFSLTSGSWPDEKFLLVYKNGQAQRIGASYDYTATDSDTIEFTYTLASDDLVQMIVVSVDLYNPAWTSVTEDIIPDTDNAHDLGSLTKTWKALYTKLATAWNWATTTPTAGYVPIASSTGKLNTSWIDYSFPSLPTAPTTTNINTTTQLLNYYTSLLVGVATSTELQLSSDTEVSDSSAGSDVLKKRFVIGNKGRILLSMALRGSSSNPSGSVIVKRNGYTTWSQSIVNNSYYTTTTEINVFPGDDIEFYLNDTGGYTAYLKEARIYYSNSTTSLSSWVDL